ncbi:MAG: RecQ family ATP-dependent DNA helicase [Crocinitomicaceae bacterium]
MNKYWGYDQFRQGQDSTIEHILEGKDCLALLPTGGGKSICYQVPGLAQEGVCLVISPLIALMQDQVKQLRQRGIKASAITAGMNNHAIDIELDNAIYGNTKFLYVSPERLRSELFKVRLAKMNINLIAVDEAHCISEWGYDFRPAYLLISEIRKIKPKTPILALTATATPEVVIDIQEKLEFKEKSVFQSSFTRQNLIYNTLETNNKLNRLIEFVSHKTESGISWLAKHEKELKSCVNNSLTKA